LFPIIAVGGTLGAIVGPFMTSKLAKLVGVPVLLYISATLLGACLVCMLGLLRWSHRHPVRGELRDERIIGGSFLAGAKKTLMDPLLRSVAVLMLLGDGVGTVVYALLSDYNRAHFAVREDGVAFAANVDFYSNIITAILQISLTRVLLVRFGPVSALVLDGLVKAVMLAGLIVVGGPWIAVVAVVTRASAYGVFKPGADSLYTQVDAETRYKAKNFIDTAVWRFGDVVVTTAFTQLAAAGLGLSGFAALTMIAAGASSWVGSRITRVLSPSRAATGETAPRA
jgi:AAA family ATP:ADP antiporter